MELRRIGRAIPYNIHIKPSDNMGFIIRIGCGEGINGPGACLVAESSDALLDLLHTYLEDPKGCEEDYNKIQIMPEVARASRPETDAGRDRPLGSTAEEIEEVSQDTREEAARE